MSKLLIGSINLSLMLDLAKKGHSSFTKASNGKVYANINVWINDKKDQYDNDAAIQLNPKKDSDHARDYIGNLKFVVREPETVDPDDLPDEVEYAF